MAEKKETIAIELPKLNPQIQAAENVPDEGEIIELNGQWIPSSDDTEISKNFKTVTNMRYTDNHPEGILGMSKVHSVARTSYPLVRNAFFFSKETPAETHLLLQAYNSIGTVSGVFEAPTSDIAFTETALWTDSAGAGNGIFSDAPNGHMAYCNGVDTCIWAGTEARCAAFITSSATLTTPSSAPTNPRDLTSLVTKNQEAVGQLININGGVDAYSVLVILADEADGTAGTDITDSSTSAHTITAVADAQVDTAYAKFGTGSVKFDGTGDYLTVPDHANWYFAGDPFTIDFWIWPTGTADEGICGQYDDASNYWFLKMVYASLTIQFKVVTGGVTKADYSTSAISGLWTAEWKHIELARSGTSMYLFFNGTAQTFTAATAVGANEVPNLTGVLEVGACSNHGVVATGWIDSFRISKGVARHTTSFSPPVTPYITSQLYWLVGCTRPAQGVKYYISGGAGAGLAVKEFNGAGWNALTITADGTTNLSATGTVSWASTVSTSKQKYIEGYYLYWYLFSITSGNPEIYYITVDVPFQGVIDVWDGYYRSIGSAYLTKTAQVDITLNVYENNYLSTDTASYADLSSITASHYIEVGFTEKQTALYFVIPDAYNNSTASTTALIYYWDGTAYKSVGTLADGTDSGGISFAKSGVISWQNSSVEAESKKTISGGYPLYYYKIAFDETFDASVRICFIGGIPIPNSIKGHSFAVHAADRLMLGCDNYGNKNELNISAQNRPDVFNGSDNFKVQFGDDKKLTGAASIFAQYTSNIYNIVLVHKEAETWNLLWNQSSEGTSWSRLRISPNVGLVAPKTLKVASVIFENNINQTKVVGIWRSSDGHYISNGQAPFCVSKQIANVFDQTKTPHINLAMVSSESSFVDKLRMEYHWLWASGSSTTLDKEYVLDLKKWFWYEIDRGTGKRLQCGTEASSSTLGLISYGFIDTGYTELLESGTSFDGSAIVNTIQTGFVPLVKQNVVAITEVLKTNLIAVAKNTTSAITMTYYIDFDTTGTDYTISVAEATKRVANVITDVYSLPGTFHSFKFVVSSSAETKGFEPLQLIINYQKVRNHTR